MKKRKNLPLMVVATAKPADVATHALKLYTTADGDFIANANLEYVFSPFTGEEISCDCGVATDQTIDEEAAVGVICHACKTINATVAHSHDEMNCVACGTHLAFDLNADGVEEEEMEEESDFDPDQFDPDEEAGDDEEDIGGDINSDDDDLENLDDEEEAEMTVEDGDEEEVEEEVEEEAEVEAPVVLEEEAPFDSDAEEIDLTDVAESMDDSVEPEFIELDEDTVAAVAAGMIVAHLSSKHANFAKVGSEGFSNGLRQAASVHGLGEALRDAGFKTVKINPGKAMASKMAAVSRTVKASVKEESTAQMAHMRRCLEIAAAGSLVGLFKKEQANVMFEELTKVLSALNVTKARSVARRVLAKALPAHNAAILATADKLMTRDAAVLSAFEEQILASDDTVYDDEDLEVEDVAPEESKSEQAKVRDRLSAAPRPVQTASTKQTPKGKEVQSFAGLFNR